MGEFVVIFIITSLILSALACALYFGRPPVYIMTRDQALQIIKDFLAGELTEMKWLVFIGHAIPMDPELNTIRLQCNEVELAAEQGERIHYVASTKRYNAVGLDQIKQVQLDLEKLIADTPVIKEF